MCNTHPPLSIPPKPTPKPTPSAKAPLVYVTKIPNFMGIIPSEFDVQTHDMNVEKAAYKYTSSLARWKHQTKRQEEDGAEFDQKVSKRPN